MALVFDEILTRGIRSGQIPAREDRAREWYRDQASANRRLYNDKSIMRSDPDRLTKRPKLGHMYMYYYEAKHKATLPYYDRLPLIFPFKKVRGGFYGINMHYLPLPYRAKLMDALYEVANNRRYDESTKLRISYDILNSTSRFRFFKPCVKRYLTSQMRSQFMYIYPSEWDIALFLPLERFQGASKATVFKDSKRMIGK